MLSPCPNGRFAKVDADQSFIGGQVAGALAGQLDTGLPSDAEQLLVLHPGRRAEFLRDLQRADVGRLGEHAGGVEVLGRVVPRVADRDAAHLDLVGDGEDGPRRDLLLLQRGGEGDRLLYRTGFERGHHRRVARRVRVDGVRVGGVVGVRRRHREHLRGVRVEDDEVGAGGRRTPGRPGRRSCWAVYCSAWSRVRRTAPPLRAGSLTVRLLGFEVAEVVDGVGQGAVAAGEDLLELGLDPGRAGAVAVHGADDVRAGACCPGTAAWSSPACRRPAGRGHSPAAPRCGESAVASSA